MFGAREVVVAAVVLAGCDRETESPQVAPQLSLRFVEYIHAEPDQVFGALTTAEMTQKFFHGTAVSADLKAGGAFEHRSGDGERVVIAGEVERVQAPSQLSYRFAFPEYDEAPTSVDYAIEDVGEGTSKLTITHAGFPGPTRTYRRVFDGWPPVLSGLKTLLESGEPLSVPSFNTDASKAAPVATVQQRYVAYIRTTKTELWDALTTAELTKDYFHGFAIQADLQAGGAIAYTTDNGAKPMIEGEVAEARVGELLAFSFNRPGAGESASNVRYQIDELSETTCRLVVVHDFTEENETYRRVAVGWPPILSGLKTLLETGKPLPMGRE